jgi:hypothetical protein
MYPMGAARTGSMAAASHRMGTLDFAECMRLIWRCPLHSMPMLYIQVGPPADALLAGYFAKVVLHLFHNQRKALCK